MDGSLLLIEDTPSLSMVYETVLRRAGHQVECAYTAEEARLMFARGVHGVVLLDMMLPDGDGLELLTHFKSTSPDTKVIVITANGSVNLAVEAMRAGAFDFLVKPFDEHRLRGAVSNATQPTKAQLKRRPEPPRQRADKFEGFIGTSTAMQEIYQTLRLIGRSTATVFITGESGTGKEVCAQAVHNLSNRKSGPFVPLNCGAIPTDLLESEVFGHLKGSFTGAIADKQGAAAAAHGGTLFLDEICEMDLSLQTKLLRFLQTSTVQPVGATRPQKVDVRIVCATNRDPAKEVASGRFREDLFYRLHVVPVHLPPLRDRGGDVNVIARYILREYAREEGKSFLDIAPQVAELFTSLPWPGNVRQLLNVIRNVVVLNDGPEVTLAMLPQDLVAEGVPAAAVVPATAEGSVLPIEGVLSSLVGQPLAQVERRFIELTLEMCKGSVPKAARMLDVSPSTLYRKKEAWERADAEDDDDEAAVG
ncbi:MAG: sigma-54 dependent transcriptional regulator [Pseudomonadota bacterium]